MTDFATVFDRKIKHKMDRSREVLPADADLLDIATERFACIFEDKGELDEMLFLGVTEGRQLFMLGFPTPSPEPKIRVYDTMRRIFKQLDVVTYAHACEVCYTTQKCVEGQQINIAPPSRDHPQRKEALLVSVVAKDAQVRCAQADIVRDAQGQATLLPWSKALAGLAGPAIELLEPEPHPTR
jgi:hypothetical protein